MRSPQWDRVSASRSHAPRGGRGLAHPRDALQRRHGNRRTQQIIQAKLNVGPADDPHEREADRIAGHAMGPSPHRGPEPVRPVRGGAGFTASPAVEQAIARARGGGRSFPRRIQERMEQVTGADFGSVRLHVGPDTDRLNDSLGARAFTAARDVFVRRSEYRPGSTRGDALLGHELTHTVQQGAAGAGRGDAAAGTVQRYVDIPSSHEGYPVLGTDDPRDPDNERFYFTSQHTAETENYATGQKQQTWFRGATLFKTYMDKTDVGKYHLLKINLGLPRRPDLRFSDDLDLAVQNTQGAEAKVFYATEEQISSSNAKLKGQVRLARTSRYLEITADETNEAGHTTEVTTRLYQVEALERPLPPMKGDTSLWSKGARLLGFGGRKTNTVEQPAKEEPGPFVPPGLHIRTPQDCFGMSVFVIGHSNIENKWFDTLAEVLDGIHLELTDAAPTKPFVAQLKKVAQTKLALTKFADDMTRDLKDLERRYGARLTAALRAAFERRRLNEYLPPVQVGSLLNTTAYGTWSTVVDSFAYHYGGVVAVSGDDYVTMENYARRDPNVGLATSGSSDPLSFFYMYSGNPDQETWYSRWVDSNSFSGFPISFEGFPD